jgi:la-related protein 1
MQADRDRDDSEGLVHHASSFEDDALPASDSIRSADAPWDEQSNDGSTGGDIRRDLRKSAEATTPTLIDEPDFDEEEEQEIASLERERLRQTARVFFGAEESDLRRTPGAQMYKSTFDQQHMRRTPGASQMHRSAAATAIQRESSSGTGDVSGLGFGLTLSTPVAASRRDKSLDSTPAAWEPASPDKESNSDHRPPRAPGSSSTQNQKGAFAAPWNLSKNSNLESRVYSPNTLRLTEDLGNLLFEEDEDSSSKQVSQLVFSGKAQTSQKPSPKATSDSKKEECWTAPYVISMDGPSRVPRSTTGRNRRGKNDGFRRSRGGHDRSSRYSEDRRHNQFSANTGGFLPHAQQPKPVRSVQPQGFQNLGSTAEASSRIATFGSKNEEGTGSQVLLNFSGAFAPPSKTYDGTFHRPVPSTAPQDTHFCPTPQPPELIMEPAYHGGTPDFGAPYHNPFQQVSSFESHPKYEAPLSSQNPMYEGGDTVPMNQSHPFSFPPSQQMGYPPMHGGTMHLAPHSFMPVHHHQRPPVPQFAPPQVWPQPQMAMQYEGHPPMEQGSWHGGAAPSVGTWPQQMSPFGYGMPPIANDRSVNMGTLGQSWSSTEMDYVAPEMQPNPFAILQQQTGPSRPVSRNSNRGKNQRKSSLQRRRRSQSRNERGARPETSTQNFGGKKTSNHTKNKKKQTKGRRTPVRNNPRLSCDDGTLTSSNYLAESKRAELNETSATRSAFKDFYKKFRAAERSSSQEAEEYAMKVLSDGSLPESIHWKVYLELADLSKRGNKFLSAKNLYQQVCRLQPYASQGWLEYSKLEEECGNMNICSKILRTGLDYCEHSENLLTRAIKHEEKMGNLVRGRELLSRLKHTGIEKVWRAVLEGALLESRAGNDVIARRVLKYLMHHVPWYGPLYLEAYKLEKDLGRTEEALAVVERGLESIPRYGPLWFGAFRLCEEMDVAKKRYDLPQSMIMIERATDNISKELIWKVHLEAATMLERASVEYIDDSTHSTAIQNMEQCKKRFAMTILTCPPNLRWKVWLASGKMEVLAGNFDTARRLFNRAQVVVPEKGRAVALLECARLEEFVGDTELARAILAKSRSISGNDWKVWLESVLLEMRNNNYSRAIELAKLGLKLHSGTGRLWASLVQLRHFDQGEEAQFESLRLALNAVPKSGEVWCEGARIQLNPFARTFDPQVARRHLLFATKFTPQYGDGFLELLRLEMIEQWLVPVATRMWESSRDHLVLNPDDNGQGELKKFVFDVSRDLYSIRQDDGSDSNESEVSYCCLDEETVSLISERLKDTLESNIIDISKLQLRCANADPNYGSMWFRCRTGPNDTARKVLSRAVERVFTDLKDHAHLYLAAFMRRFAILTMLSKKEENNSNVEVSKKCAESAAQIEDRAKEALLAVPSLEEIIECGNKKYSNEEGMDLLKSTMTGSDFISGLVALSGQNPPLGEMSKRERRKAMYGTDALFS